MSVLTVPAAKTHLGISGNEGDIKLQAVINGAEKAIARRVGPLTQTTITRRVRGGGVPALVLPVAPATSLTSLTPLNGTAIALSELDLDTDTSKIRYLSGAPFYAPRYVAVYEAGWQVGDDPNDLDFVPVPEDLLYIIKELTRHLWRPYRGGANRPGTAPSETLSNTIPGVAVTLPIRVEQLLKNFLDMVAY